MVGEYLDTMITVAPANPQGASLQEDRIMSRTVTIPQGLLACTLVLALSAGTAFATDKEEDIDGTYARVGCPGPDAYGYTCDPDCVFEFIDISATGIRQRVRNGRSVRYLTPSPVADYIAREGLYGMA